MLIEYKDDKVNSDQMASVDMSSLVWVHTVFFNQLAYMES